jgi:hypothetical protein
MEKREIGEHLKHILKKMCNIVNADYKKINFQKDNWYHEYYWSEKEEIDFIEWLTNYLYTTKEARKEILYISGRSKIICNKAARQFVFNYGWKLKK